MKLGEIKKILAAAGKHGWVLEPEAKRLCRLAGMPVTRFEVADNLDDCLRFAREIGFPLAAKIVSPDIIHKTEAGGVVTGIRNTDSLVETFERFSALPGFTGVLLENMAEGVELIVGSKNDYQFGSIVLLGIGGTGVEIYKDTVIRMAPIQEEDAREMLSDLKGRQLLEGYRGGKIIDKGALVEVLVRFSQLVTEIVDFYESIDLNPLFCSDKGCVVADARVILK